MSSDKTRTISVPVLVLLAGLTVLLLTAALILYLKRGVSLRPGAEAALGEERKAYLPLIKVADARMSAAENFLGDTVTYLDATVVNKGQKTIRELELELQFVDTLNQVVLRETVRPINPRTAPLKPGESRAFQLSFDRMPLDWNQGPPYMKATRVEF